ncbi:MAG TPA: hypothetical protein VGG61_12895, partial [Gemmataceae bacterium]
AGCTRPRCACSPKAAMPRDTRKRRQRDLADEVCAAIKDLTAERSLHSYSGQWVMVHDIAVRLGISDEQTQEGIRHAGSRLVRDADPPRSVRLIYGWGEE